MSIKKLVVQIHLWLGLSSGLIVFILGITGCIFCFEKELQDVVYQNRLFVHKQTKVPLSLDSLNAIAVHKLGSGHLDRIEIQPGSNRTYIYYDYDAPTTLYLDPYTGVIQYVETSKWEFFGVVLGLHYDLLLGDVGKLIVSWATALFVIVLITGLVLWWPKNRSAARQRYWFRWKESTTWKRKNYDLHNISGFYSLIFALLIALTGLYFGFEWFRNSARFLANGGQVTTAPKPVISDTLQLGKKPGYQAMLDLAIKQEASAEKFIFTLPTEKEETITLRAYAKAMTSTRNNLFFDQYTGRLLETSTYQKLNPGDQLGMINYDIHTGKLLGIPGMVLAFIASLIAASLPVTGFYIWWGRRKKGLKKITNTVSDREASLSKSTPRPAYRTPTRSTNRPTS